MHWQSQTVGATHYAVHFSLPYSPPPTRMSFARLFRQALLVTVVSALAGTVAFTTHRLSQRQAIEDLRETGRHRLDLYAASLEREISKYAYFPATLGLERDALDLLDERQANRVSRYLEQLNARAGTLSIYVMNRSGHVLASSNWQRADSFVGEDLSFRPYFREAIEGGKGRLFGIGTTRGEPGYYLSAPLADGERILGVAAVKVSLEQLEKSWTTVEAPVFVSDENGVIILSSVPAWKFHTLHPLDAQTHQTFARTQQFNRRALQSLDVRETTQLDAQTRIIRVARQNDMGNTGAFDAGETTVSVYPVSGLFLAQSLAFGPSNWTLTVFSNLKSVDDMSAIRATVAGVLTVLLCIITIMANEQRKHLQDRLAAREALQQANDALEVKVTERTQDLSEANRRLQDEVAERIRAERTLRAAQDELIQAGKLVVIGQLSAGIVHELNQPLAALRTLSGNTVRFLERGDEATVRANLERINQLVDRMGQITGELKHFARKSSGRARPTDLRQCVTNAVALFSQRLRSSQAAIEYHFPETPLSVLCDPNRIEQVLINLLGNALDATAGQEAPLIEISATEHGGNVVLTIRDNGTGIDAAALPMLFEPFFTTKEAGHGLGLGLTISASIAKDFGGTLAAANHPAGGAAFTLTLPRSETLTASEAC